MDPSHRPEKSEPWKRASLQRKKKKKCQATMDYTILHACFAPLATRSCAVRQLSQNGCSRIETAFVQEDPLAGVASV